MSTSVAAPDVAITENDAVFPLADQGMLLVEPGTSTVASRVIGGTSALGLGVVIERGAGFLANVLAARIGGTATFGAYSLAISTANNISTYAAGGIGATAARFSGKYPYGSPNYSNLARALAIVSVVSATLAAVALWFGAGPLAHLLGRDGLTTLLHWAVLSSVGLILLECARGFFVGQRRLVALVLLSAIVGTGMVVLLPTAARTHDAVRMIVVQGAITTFAVLACLALAKPLRLHAPVAAAAPSTSLPAMLREVWSFGLVQLAGLVCSSMAGWWLMTLVARTDKSLVQMSFFAIASQLRNLAGIGPGLLTEGSYAVMADPGSEADRTPHRVMALCSYASVGVALGLAALGIVVVPWALTALYGRSYAPAALTVAVALATAVVHMGNAPAAARLTIVSIRASGVINTIWAVVVAGAATLFLLHSGNAWKAMLIYFAAHVLSSLMVLLTLRRKDAVPAGQFGLFAFSTSGVSLLLLLAFLRASNQGSIVAMTAAMFVVLVALVAGLRFFGKRYQWLPSRAVLTSAVSGLRTRLPLSMGGTRHV